MSEAFEVVVIGSGPAGQKAAIQAAKAGRRVALIERSRDLGGSCVHRGTIPSKTLRENALRVKNMRLNAELAHFQLPESLELATLIDRLEAVVHAHDDYMRRQLERNRVELIHGRARFADAHHLIVQNVRGVDRVLYAEHIIIATGSMPRAPDHVPIDHEHIFDSDSILSMLYLPSSLTVLGSGVIASEYASIFQALGVRVTMVDKYGRPLGFLDQDLTDTFVQAFTDMGGRWLGDAQVRSVAWNSRDGVVTELADGSQVKSEKMLCAAGRVANVAELQIERAGLRLNERGLIAVDAELRTEVPHIFAAGDIIGPPSLASASMDQGRRATCNALGLAVGGQRGYLPTGIYSIPELSAVGLSEAEARKLHGEVLVGIARFEEIARGQISGYTAGMLKLVTKADARTLLGVMIVGEGATELIHIGQMALMTGAELDIFIDGIFNFPTLAEAYRVAALDITGKRSRRSG